MKRNKEVQSLTTVFSGADIFIAWLGRSTLVIELAFDTFEMLWAEASKLSIEDFAKLGWLGNHPSPFRDEIDLFDMSSQLRNIRWEAVRKLLESPILAKGVEFSKSSFSNNAASMRRQSVTATEQNGVGGTSAKRAMKVYPAKFNCVPSNSP